MMKIRFRYLYFILSIFLVFAVSCVKDNSPADCTKPQAPKVGSSITVNEGDTIKLNASGVAGAKYVWSGPHSFYANSAAPVINNASILNTGKYWARAQVGYCFSDSVAVSVLVRTDSTCNLGDNTANFPNGSRGIFPLISQSSPGPNGVLLFNASNPDSSIVIDGALKQTPEKGGSYKLISNPNPADNEVYYRIQAAFGTFYFNHTDQAYVKVKNGKINIIICSAVFQNLGPFSANIALN